MYRSLKGLGSGIKHMFSLYALLREGAPAISTESLAAELKSLFRDDTEFSLQYEQLPFAKQKSLTLRWGTWLARLSYEEGKKVIDDSAEISRILGPAAPPKLASIDKRIRAVFGDDAAQEYTNQMICLIDFLCGIKGAIVFDPQQKDIVRLSQQKGKESTENRR
jgi:hypothetical protein